MMKVRLIYRNYKPLHQAYMSLLENPPNGVEFIVPAPNLRLRRLHKIYRKVRFIELLKPAIAVAEKFLFTKKSTADDDADIYQYLNIISEEPQPKPYIVDTEHAAGLISFTPDESRLSVARRFLADPNCKGVTCWSEAAMRTLKDLMGEDFPKIKDKSHVIYPAIKEIRGLRADHEFVKDNKDKLKLLLVGNQAYLKGVEELLGGIKRLNSKYGADKLELHIISDDAAPLLRRADLSNVKLYPPRFDKTTVLKKFYIPADLFIMPTKQETFGMALLDSLACGTPVITTDQFASREIVEDGKDGLLLKIKDPVMDSFFVPGKKAMDSVTKPNPNKGLENQIYEALSKVLDGKIDIEKMGRNGRKKFMKGQRFSVETRARQLGRVYSAALRRAD